MNSKERVLAAINKKPLDRTPSDFRAEKPTLERLYRYVGHRDFDRLMIDLNVDIRYVDSRSPEEKNCGSYIENYWGERYIYYENEWGFHRNDIPGALASATSMRQIEQFTWPTVDMMSYEAVPHLCERYENYAIMYGFADVFTRLCNIRGFEEFLTDMYENPEISDFMIRKITDFYIEEYTKAFKVSGGRINIFLIMGDLATQIAPMIAPSMFDDFIGPHLKRMVERIHDLGAYAMYHSCGEAFHFYDQLIGCGIDILDPMQRTTENMAPENLANLFGSRVCFHGGIDVQTTLPYGSEDEVRAEVRRYIRAFREKCGYICSSAHYMQHDTPPENIIALYDEINKSG